jgi:hypothetical protein
MGNSPSTPNTLKTNEHPYLGFDSHNMAILSKQKMPEIKEKAKIEIDIKDEYLRIKNECPPCPKYNFEGSYEESQMKKQLRTKMETALSNYLKLKSGNQDIVLKQMINELINPKDKSPIDNISFEILLDNDAILNVIDQEIINNINKKGSPKQIKVLSESQRLKQKFKLSNKESQEQKVLLLEPQKTVQSVDIQEPERNIVEIPPEGPLMTNVEKKNKYFKYKEKYLKLKYN